MNPYFADGLVSIYHGDVREVLPQLGMTFDCVTADPPYNQTSLEWDRWPTGWTCAVHSALKPTGSMWCFGSVRMFMERTGDFFTQRSAVRWRFAQDVIWGKHNGSSFHADRFKRVHDQVLQFYRADSAWGDVYKNPVMVQEATKKTIRRKRRPPHMGAIESGSYTSEDGGPKLMRSVIQANSCHGYAQNETQKPVDLLVPLIQYSCPPGGVLLSPFGGAGSDAVAALSVGGGIRVVVIEIREEQCEVAAMRVSGGPLFREVPA